MISRLHPSATVLLLATLLCIAASAEAFSQQEPTDPYQIALRDAGRLDNQGRLTDARAAFQRLIDSAPSPAARGAAQRGMAMSYAFAGDCANTVRYEEMVIAYWKTREQAEPQNAFYQQGEMANEAARVCIDAGDLATAEKYYGLGSELGTKEPQPATHSRALWDFRLHHALGRLAARRGDKAEAMRQIEAARQSVAAMDSATASQQRRFLPYLVGYVALYTNDLATAEKELSNALAMPGNERDPFMNVLLAMTYEKLGRQDKAKELYQKGYDLALAHNPPAAYARRIAREKLTSRR
jgi:tetratricopeptide (TPR) repeat protein